MCVGTVYCQLAVVFCIGILLSALDCIQFMNSHTTCISSNECMYMCTYCPQVHRLWVRTTESHQCWRMWRKMMNILPVPSRLWHEESVGDQGLASNLAVWSDVRWWRPSSNFSSSRLLPGTQTMKMKLRLCESLVVCTMGVTSVDPFPCAWPPRKLARLGVRLALYTLQETA